MEDRTTRIPSLKEFNEAQAEKKLQNERNKSMTTKHNRSKPTDKNKPHSHRQSNGDTRRIPEGGSLSLDTQRLKTRRIQKPDDGRQKAAGGVSDTRAVSSHSDSEPLRRRAVRQTAPTDRRQPTSSHTRGGRPPSGQPEGARNERTARQDAGFRQGTAGRNGSRPANPGRTPGSRPGSPPSRAGSSRQQPRQNINRKPPKKTKPLSPAMRKLRTGLIYVTIVAAVLLVGVVLSLTVLFKTEHINVSGNAIYSADEIIAQSGLALEENIFTADKGAAERRIESGCPYIDKANVYLVIPDTINIDITIAKAAYTVETAAGNYVVSGRGKILNVASTADEISTPVVEGVSVTQKKPGEFIEYESEDIGTAIGQIFETAKQHGYKNLTAINISADKDGTTQFKYVFDNRIVVFLGNADNIEYKMITAQKIIKDKVDVNNGAIAGDLDVSMCYDTRKSYFNQYALVTNPVVEPTSKAETVPETTETQ